MSAVTYGMSATTYGVATAGTEAAPTRKSLFAWVLDALADSRPRQAERGIHQYWDLRPSNAKEDFAYGHEFNKDILLGLGGMQ